jgi:hypothetical protein
VTEIMVNGYDQLYRARRRIQGDRRPFLDDARAAIMHVIAGRPADRRSSPTVDAAPRRQPRQRVISAAAPANVADDRKFAGRAD